MFKFMVDWPNYGTRPKESPRSPASPPPRKLRPSKGSDREGSQYEELESLL